MITVVRRIRRRRLMRSLERIDEAFWALVHRHDWLQYPRQKDVR